MNISFKKSWIPNIIAVVLFAIIATVYFSPALEGYSLRQGDITNWKGMSKEIQDFRATHDSEPLWTNSMFGGMPTYQTSFQYSSGYLFFRSALGFLFNKYTTFLFIAFISFFSLLKTLKTNTYLAFFGALAYGLSTYNILIIEAGHNTKMQTLAIIPLALGFFIKAIQAKKINILFTALFSLVFGFQIFTNHLQMTYYFAFLYAGIGLTYLITAIRNNNINLFAKKTSLLIIGVIMAISSNFSSIYHTKSFAKHTMRGDAIIDVQTNKNASSENVTSSGLKKDYITGWSYGIGETYNLLVPNAKGNSRHLTNQFFDELRSKNPQEFNKVVKLYQESRGKLFAGYWGNQPFTSGPNYIGSILIFLAILYITLVPGKLKWGILAPTVLAILLAWGKNFMPLTDLFIDYFPLYNKFRTVSSFLVVVNLTVPLMAILFLNKVISDKEWRNENEKKIIAMGSGVIGLVLLLAYIPFGFDFLSEIEISQMNNPKFKPYINTIIDFRKSVFEIDSLKSVGQMAIALILVIGFIKSKIKESWLMIGLGAIVAINIWMVDKQYLNNEKDKGKYLSWQKSSPINHSINANKGDYAIYNLEKSSAIEKEIDVKIKNFRKKEGRRITNQDKESIVFGVLGANTNYRVMELSNPFNSAIVSYFHKSSGGYSPAKLRRIQDMIDFYIGDEISLINTAPQNMKVLNMLNTKYYLNNGELVFSNVNALGNAWFVDKVNTVESNNDEILEFKNIDPKKTAIIHSDFKPAVSKTEYKSANNSINLTQYRPNHLTYQANCSQLSLAVFSEIYYEDGWKAYIDGKQVDYARANYLLRALEIPLGEHKIEFKFEVPSYSWGNYINLISFFILLLTIVIVLFKKSKTTKA